uniref:Parathyroid hormone like hormone n=1 Tax=Leptobrachium leishanense TaxID=445787 RepID=A0A8C5N3V0_9ANUR
MLRSLLPHCSLAVFILSCSLPADGRPAQGINSRVRRAVSEHQLLHDKGRSLQELRRRIFLQSLIEGVNTAEIRAAPDESPRPIPSTSKNFKSEEEGVTGQLTQETHKLVNFKEPLNKTKKKKGKPGKRKEQDKRKRRERSAMESLQESSESGLWWEELNIRTQ